MKAKVLRVGEITKHKYGVDDAMPEMVGKMFQFHRSEEAYILESDNGEFYFDESDLEIIHYLRHKLTKILYVRICTSSSGQIIVEDDKGEAYIFDKEDLEDVNDDTTDFVVSRVAEWLTKEYGPKCDDYDEYCVVCRKWKLAEELFSEP
jgi:uncharacterized protein (UPF0216 family)